MKKPWMSAILGGYLERDEQPPLSRRSGDFDTSPQHGNRTTEDHQTQTSREDRIVGDQIGQI